jgi:hypothetical protein
MSNENSFDQWAVVELMGHQQIAGRVTEQSIGGAAFIRVDVPEQPARPKRQQWDSDQPIITAYSRFLSAASIYAINPCTEDVAKMAAERMRVRPSLPVGMMSIPSLPAPGGYQEDNEN